METIIDRVADYMAEEKKTYNSEEVRQAFIDGAQQQQEFIMDRAYEWLRDWCEGMSVLDGHDIDEFRFAMEKIMEEQK